MGPFIFDCPKLTHLSCITECNEHSSSDNLIPSINNMPAPHSKLNNSSSLLVAFINLGYLFVNPFLDFKFVCKHGLLRSSGSGTNYLQVKGSTRSGLSKNSSTFGTSIPGMVYDLGISPTSLSNYGTGK